MYFYSSKSSKLVKKQSAVMFVFLNQGFSKLIISEDPYRAENIPGTPSPLNDMRIIIVYLVESVCFTGALFPLCIL